MDPRYIIRLLYISDKDSDIILDIIFNVINIPHSFPINTTFKDPLNHVRGLRNEHAKKCRQCPNH